MINVQSSPAASRIRRVALGDFVHRVAQHSGHRLAVVDRHRRLTYAELDAASNRLANHLLASYPQGIQVAMLCANSADMVVAINGIHKAGAVWVPVNHLLDTEALTYILRHSEASLVVVDQALAAEARIGQALAALGLPVLYTCVSTPIAGPGRGLDAVTADAADTFPEVDIDGDQVAIVMYTSGTTGHPKGVMHSHASAGAAISFNISTTGLTPDDIVSGMLPLFHIGQHCLNSAALAVGACACAVMINGFVPSQVLEVIEREQLTFLFALPMMYGAMLTDAGSRGADLSSVRTCVYAMAPMPRPVLNLISARLTSNIMLATGQTEIYPITMVFRPMDNPDLDANYWGISTPVCETALMDDAGNFLPPGQVGEIVHRGPNVMLGYFKDEAATAQAQRFGWHHTGDLGLVDESGQMLFMDRKKDMIKTGGENVASVKVEAAVLAHGSIASCAVVGLPHPHWAEAVVAFVTLKPGTTCTEEELLAHCRTHLGKFEVPKAIVFHEQLPATATGKIQKNALRTHYASYFNPGSGS